MAEQSTESFSPLNDDIKVIYANADELFPKLHLYMQNIYLPFTESIVRAPINPNAPTDERGFVDQFAIFSNTVITAGIEMNAETTNLPDENINLACAVFKFVVIKSNGILTPQELWQEFIDMTNDPELTYDDFLRSFFIAFESFHKFLSLDFITMITETALNYEPGDEDLELNDNEDEA